MKNEKLSFGQALEKLKEGKKLSRKGWNGKGMFIYYVPQGNYPPTTNPEQEIINEDGLVPYQEYIAFKTRESTVVPWVASQTDILSNDWVVVE